MTVTATFVLQTIAEASTLRIVDCLLGGTLVGLLAGAVLKLPPRKSAGVRFAVWFSALVAIAALPWSNSMWSGVLENISHLQNTSLGHISLGHTSLGPAAIGAAALTLPGTWAVYLFAAWMGIATLCLLRLGVSLWQMHALRKSCVTIDPADMPSRLRAALESNCGTRAVSLCTSDRVQVPTALGLIAPAVVVPRWVMAELPPEELEQIVLHEVAHLRRRDDWTNLAQKVIGALFFFHPAVWWIEKRLSLEREMACDDAVLGTLAKPRAYAECLTHLAEKSLLRRSLVRRTLALAQASLGTARQTFLRVSQILDTNRPRETRHGWKWALAAFTGMAIASGILVAKEPRLIAFENPQPLGGNSTMARVIGARMMSTAVPTPAAAFVRTTRLLGNGSPSRSPRVVQAKNVVLARKMRSENGTQNIAESFGNAFVLESVIEESNPIPLNMVQASASGTAPVTSTETIFFLVQRPAGNSTRPLLEIEWYRLTVLHAIPHTTGGVIPKKT
jgi:beta-lactamase regulating signal transducer with metallopeptidase domain